MVKIPRNFIKTYHFLGGGIGLTGGSIIIRNGYFDSNSVSDRGGVMDTLKSQVDIEDALFSGNAASREAGCAYFLASDVKIRGCLFSANNALSAAGAILSVGSNQNITNTVFLNNTAIGGRGGAISVENAAGLKASTLHLFKNCTFTLNIVSEFIFFFISFYSISIFQLKFLFVFSYYH